VGIFLGRLPSKVASFCCNAASSIIQDLESSYQMPNADKIAILSVPAIAPTQTMTMAQSIYPAIAT
jgi:hypothetical protein